MAKKRQTDKVSSASAEFLELQALRLAAVAVDLRGRLAPCEIARIPQLVKALDACDALFEDLGWGRPSGPLTYAKKADCWLER